MTTTTGPGRPGFYSDLADVLVGEWWNLADLDARAGWLAGRWKIRARRVAAEIAILAGGRRGEPSVSAHYRAAFIGTVAADLQATGALLQRVAELMQPVAVTPESDL
jgi:hypothetical protein